MRRKRAAIKRVKNAEDIQRETRKIFGAPRIWSDGLYEMEGVLSEVRGKKVILLETDKVRKQLKPESWIVIERKKLSEADQDYIDKFKSYLKLSKADKEQYVNNHFAHLTLQKMLEEKSVSEAFRKLVDGFDKIEIRKHSFEDVKEILGNQVEVVSRKEKTEKGTTATYSWWATLPDNLNRRIAIQVEFRNDRVIRVRTSGWNNLSRAALGKVPASKVIPD